MYSNRIIYIWVYARRSVKIFFPVNTLVFSDKSLWWLNSAQLIRKFEGDSSKFNGRFSVTDDCKDPCVFPDYLDFLGLKFRKSFLSPCNCWGEKETSYVWDYFRQGFFLVNKIWYFGFLLFKVSGQERAGADSCFGLIINCVNQIIIQFHRAIFLPVLHTHFVDASQ